MKLDVKSTAFQSGGMIPSQYTCDGSNISPQLSWGKVPDGTKSITIISDDPDAPMGTWIHWVLFNLPPDTRKLEEGVQSYKTHSNGSIHGVNDFGKLGYGGPCPPSGTHRYFFKVYALDQVLLLQPGATNRDVLNAMRGHILAQGELMGKYRRQ
jgi:Raf kinase inhibitor-like YbhB/YbcL family protein